MPDTFWKGKPEGADEKMGTSSNIPKLNRVFKQTINAFSLSSFHFPPLTL